MFKNISKKTVAVLAAGAAAVALALTGCSGATTNNNGDDLAQLQTIVNTSLAKGAKEGFVENVNLGKNKYVLAYDPAGNDGQGSSAVEQTIVETTDESGNTTTNKTPDVSTQANVGYYNFDAVVVANNIAAGPFFLTDGGTIKKNSDGSFVVSSQMMAETVIYVKDGLITGIKQNMGSQGGADQVLETKITYRVTSEGKALIAKAEKETPVVSGSGTASGSVSSTPAPTASPTAGQ